jgi:hypothetical protein
MSDRYKTVNPSSGMTASENNVIYEYIGGNAPFLRICIRDDAYSTASEFKTAMDGVMLVYELATPTDFNTTPTELSTYKGNNTLWSDGEVTVVYGKGTKEGGD